MLGDLQCCQEQECPFHWEMNLVLTKLNRESTTGKHSQLPVSPVLHMPDTGLASIQPGYKWNNCSQVNSPDSKECCHCTEHSGAVCDLHQYKRNKSLAAETDWRGRSDPFSSRHLSHTTTTWSTSNPVLPSLFSTCPVSSSEQRLYFFLQWFLPPPLHLKQVLLSTATQTTVSPALLSGSRQDY